MIEEVVGDLIPDYIEEKQQSGGLEPQGLDDMIFKQFS